VNIGRNTYTGISVRLSDSICPPATRKTESIGSLNPDGLGTSQVIRFAPCLPPKKTKGVDLDGQKLSLTERREVESLGRKFAKLKERDRGLVRLPVAKLAQATS
jgi:hypothetical protein